MLDHIRPAITTLAFMTLLVGVAYPLSVTGVAHLAFPDQANGSLVRDDAGQVRGSRLIAQAFDGDRWFQPRPRRRLRHCGQRRQQPGAEQPAAARAHRITDCP